MFNRIFFLAAFICISGALFAQNYNDALRLSMPGLGSNARALGMGNAYNALSDDASAAFFNPAGLGLLKRLEFSGGIDYYRYSNNTSYLGTQDEYSNSSTQLNRLSFAFPFPTMRGSLVFGLSYHRTTNLTTALSFDAFNTGTTSMIQDLATYSDIPFDLYLSDEGNNTIFNGRLNQSGSILSSGNIGNWTFSGAVEAARGFFIGANLNIVTGSYNSTNDYFEEDLNNIYQGITEPTDPETADFRTFNLNRIIDWDLSGWDAKVGFLYQLDRFARFGATIQFPKNFTIKEQFDVSGYSEFGTGLRLTLDSDYYSDEVEYDISTPFSFTGAFSFNIAGLIVSAEGTLIDYSQMEFSGEGKGLSREYISRINRDIKDDLTAVLNYNVGLEYTLPAVGLRLRGGFIYHPSAFKEDPSQYDRKYLTGGIGYLAQETIGIDFGYAYGWWETFGTSYAGASRLNQEINVNNFVFTLTYRF
jgi:long-subunit fatty acid transport protein